MQCVPRRLAVHNLWFVSVNPRNSAISSGRTPILVTFEPIRISPSDFVEESH